MVDEFTEGEILAGQMDTPMVMEEPEMELELDGSDEVLKTLSEAEEEAPHESDLQSVLKKLHPKYKDKRQNELFQPIMASRIFPDNFLDLNYLLVMSLIEEQEGSDDIDITSIITMTQVATSIGYEGRARVEDLEVAGVAHEQEMEKLTKELGLG